MKRTEQSILKKVDEWKTIPEMVPAVYRLFVFLPWESIPEDYRNSFDERAAEVWNDESAEDLLGKLEVDTEVTIKAILQELAKKRIVAALALLPIILADFFMLGFKTGHFQGRLMKIVNDYKSFQSYDSAVAEIDALLAIEDLLADLVAKMKLKLSFDLRETCEKIMVEFVKPFETQENMKTAEGILSQLSDADKEKLDKNIEAGVDEQ